MYLYREKSSDYSTQERQKQNKDSRIFFKDIKSPVPKKVISNCFFFTFFLKYTFKYIYNTLKKKIRAYKKREYGAVPSGERVSPKNASEVTQHVTSWNADLETPCDSYNPTTGV